MQRYMILNTQMDAQHVQMNEEDTFHMRKVMRMSKGDQVYVIDEDEQVYLCTLLDEKSGLLKIEQRCEEDHELDVHVRLIYGLPKLDKFEMVIQKATELGVEEIVPFLSARSLIRTDASRFSKKRVRYEKIIKEALEQSERTRRVRLHDPMTLKELQAFVFDHGLVAYEEDSRRHEHHHFADTLTQLKAGDWLNIVVGPEGGLEISEVNNLTELGYVRCSLGKRILRSETAPLYMLSVIGFYRELKEEL